MPRYKSTINFRSAPKGLHFSEPLCGNAQMRSETSSKCASRSMLKKSPGGVKTWAHSQK